MQVSELERLVSAAFADRDLLQDGETRIAVEETIELLDTGKVRVAEKRDGEWRVNAWVKEAILLYFAMRPLESMEVGGLRFFDKIPVKTRLEEQGIRVVPPGVARYGSFLEPGSIMMPGYVNIGAYVGAGTMVDTWATVGSCAQIGKGVHLSGGVGIGGVLEPPGATPVIIEDGAFIGSRSIVVEGVVVEEEAEEYFLSAKALATQADARQTAGDVELNLGIIAHIRGELQTSLHHYETSLADFEIIGNDQSIARVLNNLGMLYTDLSDYSSAAPALNRALQICRSIGDVQVEGIVLTNRTELLLALGDLEGARSSCDEAFEISSRLANGQLKADALKSYGVIYRDTGKPHLAESHFQQAIALAAELGHPLIEADANRELALVLRSENKNREALAALNRAHALFSNLQAKQEQADIAKRFEQLEADFLSLVARWGDSIEAKDRYTRGHCQRVAEYACQIADLAGFPEQDLTWFRMGAFLHDLGKTEVPEAILNKPGRLTDEERLIIERHTVVGDEMLKAIEFPWDIRPMVRSHHERWDGAGYPDGLKATAIPLAARILHVADVFDALTTTRSYREPLTREEAFAIMESDKGSFDPELFELFRSILPTLLTPDPSPDALSI